MTNKNLSDVAAAATKKLFADTTTSHQVHDDNQKKQVFSFRGSHDSVKAWRLYARISGTRVDDLGSKALDEYISNHPLTGAEKAVFDERMNS